MRWVVPNSRPEKAVKICEITKWFSKWLVLPLTAWASKNDETRPPIHPRSLSESQSQTIIFISSRPRLYFPSRRDMYSLYRKKNHKCASARVALYLPISLYYHSLVNTTRSQRCSAARFGRLTFKKDLVLYRNIRRFVQVYLSDRLIFLYSTRSFLKSERPKRAALQRWDLVLFTKLW